MSCRYFQVYISTTVLMHVYIWTGRGTQMKKYIKIPTHMQFLLLYTS